MATETLSPSVRVYSGSSWSTMSSSSAGYAAFGKLSTGAYRGIEISFKTTKATTSEFDFRIPQCISGTNATSGYYTWYYCLSTTKVSGAPNTATGNIVSWSSKSVYGNKGTYANAQLQFSVSGIKTGTTYYLYVYSTGPVSGSTGDGYINYPSAYNYYLETTSYTITCKNRYYNSSGTLVSTTTQGTASYNQGAIAAGSDWGITSPVAGYYYDSCTTNNSVQTNATVYRNFYPNSYTVKYNVNGGSGSISNTSRYYNESYTLTSSKPTRTNYTFLGWSTNSSATSASYSSGGTVPASSSTSTITYYAVWKQNTTFYYRMYDVTNGKYLDTSSSTSTASSITRPSVPTGYTYAGYKYHTSFEKCISQSSYDGTETSCSTNTNYPYILFCYTSNSGTTTNNDVYFGVGSSWVSAYVYKGVNENGTLRWIEISVDDLIDYLNQ